MRKMLNGWELINNYSCSSMGRIWVIFDSSKLIMKDIMVHNQFIHCTMESDEINCWCTIVYGSYIAVDRMELYSKLIDVSKMGSKYTWTNNQSGSDRIWRTIDWCFVNDAWLSDLGNAYYDVLAPGVSDHSPLVIKMHNGNVKKGGGFKFYNVWCEHQDFIDYVKRGWNININGVNMYGVYQKLKNTKCELKRLSRRDFSGISIRIIKTREFLFKLQNDLQANSSSSEPIDEERVVHKHFCKLIKWEESIVRQKSRMKWIALGHKNTRFFHMCIKQRINRKEL
ncbi:uncharacterized protein LOC126681644 [Mercurialis annua]|uniref:uncharacterized protein LOC126681644 n=1 Tax=Mercurialis annua TaxID=3986 RepID=UPI00215FA7B2|nr:uncharacterized protein LOC126681644 [Mercurialis annua]